MADNRIFDGDFTTASAVGPIIPSYPVEGDTSAVLYRQDFMVDAQYYSRLALDTAHATISGAYLVDESTPQHYGGGIVQFTRTYAKIPNDRNEYETYSYTVPGIGYDDPLSFREWIASASTAAGSTTLTIDNPPHSFSTGDWVSIDYWVYDSGTGLFFLRQSSRDVNSSTSSTIVVDEITDTYTIARWNSVYLALVNRPPFQQAVMSTVTYKYYLPGVTSGITTVADIPILTPTLIESSDGVVVDTYTGTTTPSLSDYRTAVSGGDTIVVEPSTLRRYAGNIWERATRYITAI